MRLKQRALSLFIISIFVLAVVSFTPARIPSVKAQGNAALTGMITDKGVDVNNDSLFDFLEIDVQVNVSTSDTYAVQVGLFTYPGWSVNGTVAPWGSFLYTLPPGIWYMNVSIDGPWIRAFGMNFSSVHSIQLSSQPTGLSNVSLSKTYTYSEFDSLASFTPFFADKGVSTDSSFDYLEVDTQINVQQASWLDLSAALYASQPNMSIQAYQSNYFTTGLNFVNFTFQGPQIYFNKFNATSVTIQMTGSIASAGWITIDRLIKPLSKTYYYNDFIPHAYLTGRIYDKGVDTDHDGLYDYLQVSVEANVTATGNYLVSATGLSQGADEWNFFPTSGPFFLSNGIHLFNLTFYGPAIARAEANPTNITGVTLEQTVSVYSTSGQTIEQLSSISLSRQYNFTEFDHEFTDSHLTLIVNPDGSVGVSAEYNATHMLPPNDNGPVVNASARLWESNNITVGRINGTIGLPPYVTVPWTPYTYQFDQDQFPTNQTTADFINRYNNGILTANFNVTSVFPSIVKTQYPFNTTDFALYGTYSGGLLHAQLSTTSTIPQGFASQLPFNVTDVTLKANLGSNNEFRGNITVSIISGLPVGTLIVNFEGNRSAMFFTGYINVPYGTYGDMVVNATTVAQLISQIRSNLTGEGPQSLFNATQGTLELANVDITNTSITGGVRIDYNASIRGDFAALMAKLINNPYSYYYDNEFYPAIYAALNATLSSVDDMSFTLAYTHADQKAQIGLSFDSNVRTLWANALKLVPPTLPSNLTQTEINGITSLLDAGNATAYAVQNAWLNVTYSGTIAQPSLIVSASLVANGTQLKTDTEKLMPDLLSLEYLNAPQIGNITRAYLNNTYATLDSCNTTIHLQSSIVTFRTDFSFKGDLNKQLDAAKTYYVNILNYEDSLMNFTLQPQFRILNETGINISNLDAELQYGRDSAFLTVTGIVLHPPRQVIDNFRFKMTDFLNVTSEYNEPPIKYQKLKIIIQGGSNSTYTIIPTRPTSVPASDKVSLDGKTFTWENTTLSGLSNMIFNIAYQGSYTSGGTTYYVPILSNSTASNFGFDLNTKTISFNVTGAPGTKGFFNMTLPRALLDANNQSSWIIEIDGTPLTSGQYNITQNADYTFIYLTYMHSSHKISVTGNMSSVPEMPPNIIPLILLIAGLIAALLIVTQRKKIRTIKTKSLAFANRISNRFERLVKKQA
jgi:hypothetical protein